MLCARGTRGIVNYKASVVLRDASGGWVLLKSPWESDDANGKSNGTDSNQVIPAVATVS